MRRRATDSYYKNAYNTAREYPGTIAAVIVGIGVTAALLWAVRRSGGWREFQNEATNRLQQGDELRPRRLRPHQEPAGIADGVDAGANASSIVLERSV